MIVHKPQSPIVPVVTAKTRDMDPMFEVLYDKNDISSPAEVRGTSSGCRCCICEVLGGRGSEDGIFRSSDNTIAHRKMPKWSAKKASRGVGFVLVSPTIKRRNLGEIIRTRETIKSKIEDVQVQADSEVVPSTSGFIMLASGVLELSFLERSSSSRS